MNAGRTVVFIGPERTDARSVKRIAALADQGWQVTGFTFHRDRGQPDPPPAWENIHLGNTYSRRHLHRAWAIFKAFGIMFRHRRRLREAAAIMRADCFIARLSHSPKRRRPHGLQPIAAVKPSAKISIANCMLSSRP